MSQPNRRNGRPNANAGATLPMSDIFDEERSHTQRASRLAWESGSNPLKRNAVNEFDPPSYAQGSDSGLASWPSVDGLSIEALRSRGSSSHTAGRHIVGNTRYNNPTLPQTSIVSLDVGSSPPQHQALSRAARMAKNRMGPPKSLPGRRGANGKKSLRITVVTSNVQATPSNLSMDLPRLLVKKCIGFQRSPVRAMRLLGGDGKDETEICSSKKTQTSLAAFAKKLKVPFQDTPATSTDVPGAPPGFRETAAKQPNRDVVSV